MTAIYFWAIGYSVRQWFSRLAATPQHGKPSIPAIEFVVSLISLVVRYLLRPALWVAGVTGILTAFVYTIWVALDWALS